MANAIFETLATYDAFAPDPKGGRPDDDNDGCGEGDPPLPWTRMTSDFRVRRFAPFLEAEFERPRILHAEEKAKQREPNR